MAAKSGTVQGWFGGESLFPLGILFGLNLVDEFDRIAFTTLAPEIRDALGVSDATMVSIATLAFGVIIVFALPIGYAADRSNRIGISIAAAALWALAAIATGLATAVLVVFTARLMAGAGRLVNDSVHPSLLSDYYPARSLPLVSAIHRGATNAGALLAGPLAGLIAAAYGWRATFFVAALPTVVFILLATRLREPRRIRAHADFARPKSFISAFDYLRKTLTLRRLWLAAFLYGGAFIPFLSVVLSLFFERVHGFDTEQRGALLGLYGLGGIIGLFLGSWWSKRAFADGRSDWLASLIGLSFVGFGGGLIVMALIPWPRVAVLVALLIALGANAYLPPYTTLVALVTPRSLRAQAYTYSLFFYAIGAIMFSQLAARTTASFGLVGTCILLGTTGVVAGLIAATAASRVRDDIVKSSDPTDQQPPVIAYNP